jgi:hypothetical protein
MRLRGRGIHRIRRADQMGAAVKQICAALAAMASFIALPLNNVCSELEGEL